SMNVNLQGYVGIMMVTGAADDPPIAVGNSWCDYVGGLTTCFAILQALVDRQQTGVGANLDMAQFECNLSPLAPLLLASSLASPPSACAASSTWSTSQMARRSFIRCQSPALATCWLRDFRSPSAREHFPTRSRLQNWASRPTTCCGAGWAWSPLRSIHSEKR